MIPKKVKITTLKIQLRQHAFVSFNWSKCCIFGLFLKKNLLTRTQAYEDELFKYFDRKALLKVITQAQKAILNNGHYSSAATKRNSLFQNTPFTMH